jgi:hypothetical protein
MSSGFDIGLDLQAASRRPIVIGAARIAGPLQPTSLEVRIDFHTRTSPYGANVNLLNDFALPSEPRATTPLTRTGGKETENLSRCGNILCAPGPKFVADARALASGASVFREVVDDFRELALSGPRVENVDALNC